VYTESEMVRLIDAIDGLRTTRITPRTFRTLLLLLYGTGLRLGLSVAVANMQLHSSDQPFVLI